MSFQRDERARTALREIFERTHRDVVIGHAGEDVNPELGALRDIFCASAAHLREEAAPLQPQQPGRVFIDEDR